VLDLYPYGATSPIYVIVNRQPIRSADDARYFVTWLDQLAALAEAHAGWNDETERRTVRQDIARARAFFEERSR